MTEQVTALEAADILGVSLNQIRQLTFQRKLVVSGKRGRTVLYDLDAIQAYHHNREGGTTCQASTTSAPQPNESAATQPQVLYDYSSTI
jgi:phage terminase Nu1 subunit (DNA packaging protein)